MRIGEKLREFTNKIKRGQLNPGDKHEEDVVGMVREIHDEVKDMNDIIKVAAVISLRDLAGLGINKEKTIADVERMFDAAQRGMKAVVGLEYENYTEMNIEFGSDRYLMFIGERQGGYAVKVYTIDDRNLLFDELVSVEDSLYELTTESEIA